MMSSLAIQSGNRFADYFVICGLDLDSGLEPDRFNGDNLQSTPLDRSYKSKVLGHYPENVPWNPFDKNAVCMLCLPNGLHFRTQKHSVEPCFHSFVITREDGTRSYGFSYVFYEEVHNRKICSAMQTLQAMHLTELSSCRKGSSTHRSRQGLSNDAHNTRSLPRHFKLSTHQQGAAQSYYDVTKDTLYVSKSIALISQLPYVYAARKFLEGLHSNVAMLAIISGMRLVLGKDQLGGPNGRGSANLVGGKDSVTDSDIANRNEVATELFGEQLAESSASVSLGKTALGTMDKMLTESILSALPCCSGDAANLWLDLGHRLQKGSFFAAISMTRDRCITTPSEVRLSIESYVHNLLYEVPIPQPGRSIRLSCFCGLSKQYESVVIQRPSSIEELPVFDFPLREMFTLLGVECVIQLFTCVLLENQVLLCSSDYQRLMIVAESITCLLFPFTWQHVYVPILPASLQHFLDAPVPFVMGLHSCESHVKIASEGDLCYVDIDNRRIQLPEELPTFPQRQELISELSELFSKHSIPTGLTDRKICDNTNSLSYNSPMGNIMSTSCTLSSSSQFRRKHSWSHDSDSGVSDGSSVNGSHSSIGGSPQSEALQKIVAIVRRTGVSLDDIDGNLNTTVENEWELSDHEQYTEDLQFNIAVREIFLNRFVHIFSAYEHFVIQPNQDRDQWLSNRDSMQNFDKATFLSDQPEQHLPFLSRFIESQMFATLIDNKIMTMWSEVDPNLRVFDRRICLHRKRFGEGLVRTPSYEPCTSIRDSQLLLEKRLANIDVTVPPPREVKQNIAAGPLDRKSTYYFPLLDSSLLKEPHRSRKRTGTHWRHRKDWQYPVEMHHSKAVGSCREEQVTGSVADSFHVTSGPACSTNPPASLTSLRQPKLSTDMSPAHIAQTNWQFVERLLRDCKSKTKRMLVEKMGTEAVELGHGGDVSIVGIEENTLIASLCDLLERIWSHGLQQKQGKSGLWSHLMNYQELEESNDTSKPIDTNFLTPDLSSMALETDLQPVHAAGHESRKSPDKKSPGERKTIGPLEQPALRPLPVSLTFDMRNVQAMTDIKTHIGYARAWVRLALEKKLLSRHLRTLLSDTALLRSLYKRSAFLRCEDEKEQFLYHLLTLNAVDYFCFTNTYTNTKLPYRVVIFPSRRASAATTSANAWVAVSGTLGESTNVPIPRGSLDFVFHRKNLGVLTTLCIGHDNSGPSPKWMVEHVIVRNEVTGHTFKFPCGRWLGRGIDDGSTERLLVGELVPRHVDNEELVESCRTPPRCRSPSVPRRSAETRPTIPEIQRLLGDAVNSIVKFYYRKKHEKDRSTLTLLLCGEMGLVYCLEQVFLYGFKSARLFGKNLYLWDYFVRVREQFEMAQSDEAPNNTQLEVTTSHHFFTSSEEQCSTEDQAVMQCYCNLVDQINGSSHTLGKDGKFQLFVCLCARDHLLHHMIPCIASRKVTTEMFEEQSFLRNPSLVTFLRQILGSLDEFDIVLENSLTKGIGQ